MSIYSNGTSASSSDERGTNSRDSGPKRTAAANCFPLRITNPGLLVFQYDVRFEGDGGTDVGQDLRERMPPCESERIMRQFFDLVIKWDEQVDRSFHPDAQQATVYVFDGINVAYSTADIGTVETTPFTRELFPEREKLWDALAGDVKSICVRVSYSCHFPPAVSPQFLEFLNAVTWKAVVLADNHYVTESGAYEKNAVVIPNEVRVGRKGFTKHVMNAGDSLFLQLLPSNELFFPVLSVYCYLIKQLSTTDGELAAVLADPRCLEAMELALHDLMVRDVLLKNTFRIKRFSQKRIKKLKVEHNGKTMPLVDYFEKVHGHRVANPQMPCVVEETPKGQRFHLLEKLEIVDGQRGQGLCALVDATHEQEMFRAISKLEMNTRLYKLMDVALACKKDLQHFGMELTTSPALVPYTQLHPPTFGYSNDSPRVKVDPRARIPWDLSGQFHCVERPQVGAGQTWGLLDIENGAFTEKKKSVFVKHLLNYGIHLQLGQVIVHSAFPTRANEENPLEFCRTWMAAARERNNRVLIVVCTDEWKRRIHSMMKFLELEFKLLTVFVPAADAAESKFRATVGQVVHKTVARLGGLNFALNTQSKLPLLEEVNSQWSNRQFFALHTQQLDHCFQATSARSFLTYTTSGLGAVNGVYWLTKVDGDVLQRAQLEMLLGVSDWLARQKNLPADVFVFVSSFNSEQVVGLNKMLRDLSAELGLSFVKYETMPRFFVVNVESNSGESLHQAEVILQKNLHADELPAGVCVDEKIVDKDAFLLIPCWPKNMAMSASRPSKFHVHAAGDYSFDRRHVEYVVFFLCAMHPVERRLIDLPLPLRAAVDFVKRAASNLDTLKMLSGLEEAEEMEDPFDEELPMEKRVQLLNKRLVPPVKTYFCA